MKRQGGCLLRQVFWQLSKHADSDYTAHLAHFLYKGLSYWGAHVYETIGKLLSGLVHHVFYIETAVGDFFEDSRDDAWDVLMKEAYPHMVAGLHKGSRHVDTVADVAVL